MCLKQLMGQQVQQMTSSTSKRLTQITKAALEDPKRSLHRLHATCRLEASGIVLKAWLEAAAIGRHLRNHTVRAKQFEQRQDGAYSRGDLRQQGSFGDSSSSLRPPCTQQSLNSCSPLSQLGSKVL